MRRKSSKIFQRCRNEKMYAAPGATRRIWNEKCKSSSNVASAKWCGNAFPHHTKKGCGNAVPTRSHPSAPLLPSLYQHMLICRIMQSNFRGVTDKTLYIARAFELLYKTKPKPLIDIELSQDPWTAVRKSDWANLAKSGLFRVIEKEIASFWF